MPKVITELLHLEWTKDKSTSVAVGKSGVNIDVDKGKPGGGTTVNVGGSGRVNVLQQLAMFHRNRLQCHLVVGIFVWHKLRTEVMHAREPAKTVQS